MPGYEPDRRSSALDFLAMIRGQSQTTGYTDVLDASDVATIDHLLSEYGTQGWSASLERRAHLQLVSLRGNLMSGAFLDSDQLHQLDSIIAVGTPPASRPRQASRFRGPRLSRRTIWTAVIVAVLAIGGSITGAIVASIQNPAGPPVVTRPIVPPAQNGNLPQTGLQQTMSLFGPWATIAPTQQTPATRFPAVLVLHADGSTEASLRYTIPASASDWTPVDQSQVTSYGISVNGNQVDIMSNNQLPFVVTVNQPFIQDTDPTHVYRVSSSDTVYVISLAAATADSQNLSH